MIKKNNPEWVEADGSCQKCVAHYKSLDQMIEQVDSPGAWLLLTALPALDGVHLNSSSERLYSSGCPGCLCLPTISAYIVKSLTTFSYKVPVSPWLFVRSITILKHCCLSGRQLVTSAILYLYRTVASGSSENFANTFLRSCRYGCIKKLDTGPLCLPAFFPCPDGSCCEKSFRDEPLAIFWSV